MTVLIPIHGELDDPGRRAIERGLALVADDPNPELVVLGVRTVSEGDRRNRGHLRKEVEAAFGELPAHYVVRDGVVPEETVLDEAARVGADHIVVSERPGDHDHGGGLGRYLRGRLGLEVELASYLDERSDATVHDVTAMA